MHIKDDHTDLYQSYKKSDDANQDNGPVDDFLKIASEQATEQNNFKWAQFAHRHIKLKKRMEDYKLVRPSKNFIKMNQRNIQQRNRQLQVQHQQHQSAAAHQHRMIQVVNDQEHSPSSTGTSDSNTSNEKLVKQDNQLDEDNDDEDDQTIDVETVGDINHAPVRVSVIVENPNHITPNPL